MKLYRSTHFPKRWFAHSPAVGWVMFPSEIDGWQKRQAARGVDPLDIREVPIHLAFHTGIPGTPMPDGGSSEAPIRDAA